MFTKAKPSVCKNDHAVCTVSYCSQDKNTQQSTTKKTEQSRWKRIFLESRTRWPWCSWPRFHFSESKECPSHHDGIHPWDGWKDASCHIVGNETILVFVFGCFYSLFYDPSQRWLPEENRGHHRTIEVRWEGRLRSTHCTWGRARTGTRTRNGFKRPRMSWRWLTPLHSAGLIHFLIYFVATP